MANSWSLGDLMTPDFDVVTDDEQGSPPARLSPPKGSWSVGVERSGRVRSVWSDDGRGTAIVASADTPAEDIASSSSLLQELNLGHAAIVVLDEGRPVGVVSAARFADYLADKRGLRVTILGETSAGDAGLVGARIQPRLVIVCGTCGMLNELQSWIEGVTLCENTPPSHILVRP